MVTSEDYERAAVEDISRTGDPMLSQASQRVYLARAQALTQLATAAAIRESAVTIVSGLLAISNSLHSLGESVHRLSECVTNNEFLVNTGQR